LDNEHHVLFLRGLKDDGTVKILRVTGNNSLLYNTEGSCNVFENIGETPFNKQLITLDANAQQDIQFADTHLVFNQIANADTHKIALSKAEKLCNSIKNNIVCINHPAKIARQTRDQLAKLLANINGIITPQTIRFSPTSFEQVNLEISVLNWNYPVIIRQCGDHNGRNMAKLEKAADAKKLSYTFFQNECYLSQFIDYADNKGIFRKLRLVVVDGKIFLRHVLYKDDWKVSAAARAFMKDNSWYYDYEKQLIESFDSEIKPRIIDAACNIQQAIELDYFGIDCALNEENKLLIFEINPNMNILYNAAPQPSILTPVINDIKKQIINMISNRL